MALVVGSCAALLGHRWGAYVAVGAVVVRFWFYLVGAILAYRATMRRPWPKVAPLEDEDEDW